MRIRNLNIANATATAVRAAIFSSTKETVLPVVKVLPNVIWSLSTASAKPKTVKGNETIHAHIRMLSDLAIA